MSNICRMKLILIFVKPPCQSLMTKFTLLKAWVINELPSFSVNGILTHRALSLVLFLYIAPHLSNLTVFFRGSS